MSPLRGRRIGAFSSEVETHQKGFVRAGLAIDQDFADVAPMPAKNGDRTGLGMLRIWRWIERDLVRSPQRRGWPGDGLIPLIGVAG